MVAESVAANRFGIQHILFGLLFYQSKKFLDAFDERVVQVKLINGDAVGGLDWGA